MKQRWEYRWRVVFFVSFFFLRQSRGQMIGAEEEKTDNSFFPHLLHFSSPSFSLSAYRHSESSLAGSFQLKPEIRVREGFGRADIAEWRSRSGRAKRGEEEESKGIRWEIPRLRQTGSREKTKSWFFLRNQSHKKKHSSVEQKNPSYHIVMPQLDNMTALNHASVYETAFTTPAAFDCHGGKFLES